MSRNGPLALLFHAFFVVFMLAPIVIVCFVAFTPTGYLSFPTHTWSLRWFRAILGRFIDDHRVPRLGEQNLPVPR